MPSVPSNPALVKAQQLTNPPRSRVIGRGIISAPINPFAGLSTLQLINIQTALQARAAQLKANPAATPGASSHLSATTSVLTLLGKRLATAQPSVGVLNPVAFPPKSATS
jgi:hypothetical protein